MVQRPMVRPRNWGVLVLASIGGLLLCASPATAAASRYTEPFKIQFLEVSAGGYDIMPQPVWPATSVNDPADCTNPFVGRYYLRVSNLPSLEDRENVAKTLLAAFLAGRKVMLYVHGTVCNGASPYYYGVMLASDQ